MPEILVKYEDKIIERVVTEKKRISIGRTSDNDIVLDNRGVSRKHAQIEFNGNTAVILDNESLNGTFVNNRKVAEEILKDNDVITIGKYQLIYHVAAGHDYKPTDMDGTMVLKTKKQRELLEKDLRDRQIVTKYGGPVLQGVAHCEAEQFKLDRDVVTFGKSSFVNIQVKGFWVSGIQAKLIREDSRFVLVNVGRRGRVKVNGEPVERVGLRNDDLLEIGRSVFRFVEGSSR